MSINWHFLLVKYFFVGPPNTIGTVLWRHAMLCALCNLQFPPVLNRTSVFPGQVGQCTKVNSASVSDAAGISLEGEHALSAGNKAFLPVCLGATSRVCSHSQGSKLSRVHSARAGITSTSPGILLFRNPPAPPNWLPSLSPKPDKAQAWGSQARCVLLAL